MRDYVASLIADDEAKLAGVVAEIGRLERERIALEASLAAYRKIQDHAAKTRVRSTVDARNRSLSETWQKMLRFVAARRPHTTTNDDLAGYAEQEGINVSRENLRSQLSL